jgi:hypothetical protein
MSTTIHSHWKKERRTSPEENETQDEKTDHQNNLCARKPEFGFSIEANGKEIEGNNDDQHDGDPNGNVNIVGPVVDDQTGGCDFVGDQDSKGVPVEIAERETHGS